MPVQRDAIEGGARDASRASASTATPAIVWSVRGAIRLELCISNPQGSRVEWNRMIVFVRSVLVGERAMDDSPVAPRCSRCRHLVTRGEYRAVSSCRNGSEDRGETCLCPSERPVAEIPLAWIVTDRYLARSSGRREGSRHSTQLKVAAQVLEPNRPSRVEGRCSRTVALCIRRLAQEDTVLEASINARKARL
jgi:hypothetical protein